MVIEDYQEIINWINSDDPDKFSHENLQQIFQAGESNPSIWLVSSFGTGRYLLMLKQ